MNTYLKFGVLMAVIVGTLMWLAVGGVNETKTYYKTVSELETLHGEAKAKRLRVAGDVQPGSIVRKGKEVEFVLTQDAKTLKVIYAGSDPLPDTFRDRAQAVADGKLGHDGVFHATRIQAKCASKYEAKPGQPQNAPVYQDKRTS
ncbi:MAG: cytochrome c maturation protein CcmE [Bryobacterales bacterium]|nr:cytochrome c maturation protein CcmE [Bryobacterales bacterium]